MKTKQSLVSLVIIAVLASVSLRAMPQIGDLSPRFDAADQNSNRVKTADYLGKKSVLLFFYPKDFSPGCTREVTGFQARLANLAKDNVVVIGVSHDSIASHAQFARENHLDFPLISDPDGRIAHAFGAHVKTGQLCKRISFLISPDGHIVQITESEDPQKHFEEMQTAIAQNK